VSLIYRYFEKNIRRLEVTQSSNIYRWISLETF
jgi:hypothetical protein